MMSAAKAASQPGHRPARVCLVRPPTLSSASAVGQDAVPPLGLAYVAAALCAAGHRVHAVDAVGEAVHQYSRVGWSPRALLHGLRVEEIVARIDPRTDVIGVSCMFSVEWPLAQELVAAIRGAFPRALIVAGGEHVTACPELTLTDCPAIDVAVLGEGEETAVELVAAHATGRDLAEVAGIVYRRADGSLARTAPRARIRAIDEIAPPAWSLFPIETYIDNALTHGANLGRSMPILASRGCPYQCTFCSSPRMWTTRWTARRPEAVVAEMKEYMRRYRVTNFDFYDLTAIVKRSWIVEFARLLIAERLEITWQLPTGTRSEAIDEEVAQLLYASGCRIISYAPESGSRAELARIRKKVDLDRMLASMRAARRAGLSIKANFVFGFPGSSWRDVLSTFRFLARLAAIGVDDVNVFPFCPYPGTEMFDQLRQAGRLRLDDEYFRSLLAYNDPQHSVSYAELIGSRGLSWLNLVAMAFFYTLSFTLRPVRAVKLVAALLTRDSSTRLTMALANRRRRRVAMQLARRQGRDTVTIPPLDTPRPVRFAQPARPNRVPDAKPVGTVRSLSPTGSPPLITAFRLMRRIDQYLGPPLCLLLGTALSLARRLPLPAKPRPGRAAGAKILVIKFWGMGSIVLTTPALRALKKADPDCHITFLTFEQNEPICRMIPLIDRVHSFRAAGPLGFLESLARLAFFLRRERFDAVVDFEFFANFTSILAGIANAPERVGFHSPKHWRDVFYTTRVPFEPIHITENFLRAAEALGAKADGLHLDALQPADGAAARLERLLRERGIAAGDPLICVNVNASSLDYKRRWPLESYRQLIERVVADFGGVRLALIGSKEEAAYVGRLKESLFCTPQVVDLSGMLGHDELVLLLQRSELFIGNDSGPLHLAAAAGVPTVSFFGPETPALYGPRGSAHTVFYAGIPCSPCLNVHNSKDNSGCRNNVCLQSIQLDEVWAVVRDRLSEIQGGASFPRRAVAGR